MPAAEVDIGWAVDVRAGALFIALDYVVDGELEDAPRMAPVSGPDDVARALVADGVGATEACAASEALWERGREIFGERLERVLVGVREQPFPARYDLRNQWSSVRAGALRRVYAGSLASEPCEGVVLLARASAQGSLGEHVDWKALAAIRIRAAGPLTIVAADDDVVDLEDDAGGSWQLEVVSGTLRERSTGDVLAAGWIAVPLDAA
jgi:hypothetical protein